MNIKELLLTINNFSIKYNTSQAFIVGGVPRDKLLNRLDKISDIDLTTGDSSIRILSNAIKMAIPGIGYKDFPDGHSQMIVDKIKIDFSSNFRSPAIKSLLSKAGIKNPTEMQCELYSRDFTCNSLLLSLDLKNIYDPTGLGIKDINKKVIRTCLPAQITLSDQNKRIVRVIYLATKLGFEVDEEIINWVKKNPHLFANAKSKFITEKLQKAIKSDKDKTVRLIDSMNLWKYVPPLPDLIPYIKYV